MADPSPIRVQHITTQIPRERFIFTSTQLTGSSSCAFLLLLSSVTDCWVWLWQQNDSERRRPQGGSCVRDQSTWRPEDTQCEDLRLPWARCSGIIIEGIPVLKSLDNLARGWISSTQRDFTKPLRSFKDCLLDLTLKTTQNHPPGSWASKTSF